MIKVSHFNASFSGGAAIASRQLSSSLIRSGINSELFYTSGPQSLDSNFRLNLSLVERAKNKIATGINFLINDDPFFSLTSNSSAIKCIENKAKTSIVHIHNFYNLLSARALHSIMQKSQSIVLTAHDQRFITGGCHYSLDCAGFKTGCLKCPIAPALLSNKVKQNFDYVRKSRRVPIRLIAPSRWLFDLMVHSLPNELFTFHHIENVLDYESANLETNRFRKGQIRIGFAAAQRHSFVKGTDIANQIFWMSGIDSSYFRLLKPSHFNFDMDAFWNSIDILFVPSRIDNQPNVIVEAHIRGIPVIASSVGGIPEQLFEGFDAGFQIEDLDVHSFSALVNRIATRYSNESALAVRNAVIERIDSALAQHIELYGILSAHEA